MSSFPGLLRKPGNEAATAATGILYHCMLYGLFEVVCSLLGGGALDPRLPLLPLISMQHFFMEQAQRAR